MADDPDDDPGLSDREKELREWNQPYVYHEYPKMLFRGTTTPAGKVDVEQRIVGNAAEEQQAAADGWHAGPKEALEAETRRREARAAARWEQRARKREDWLNRVLDKREERRKKLARDGSDEPDVDLAQEAQHEEARTDVPATAVPSFAEQLVAAMTAKRVSVPELAAVSINGRTINERSIQYYRVGTRVPKRIDVIRHFEIALDTTFHLPERPVRRRRTKRSAKARKSP